MQAGMLRITEGREVLTVEANAAADTNITAATAAYDARQLIYDADFERVYACPRSWSSPQVGILCLWEIEVNQVSLILRATTKTKLNAAQKLFNATGLGLGFPADDLDNFFRNGGTLNLGIKTSRRLPAVDTMSQRVPRATTLPVTRRRQRTHTPLVL